MSLVIAIWEDPSRFALAADTRVVSHLAGLQRSTGKTFTRGGWLGGWAGSLYAAQSLVRAIGDLGDTREAAEEALRAAWSATLATCGQRPGDGPPFVDVDLLLVGPPGIIRLAAHGSVTWAHEPFAAIGCADEYVTGWFDRRGGPTSADPDVRHLLHAVMMAACARYPGVGAPIDVLTAGGDRV